MKESGKIKNIFQTADDNRKSNNDINNNKNVDNESKKNLNNNSDIKNTVEDNDNKVEEILEEN